MNHAKVLKLVLKWTDGPRAYHKGNRLRQKHSKQPRVALPPSRPAVCSSIDAPCVVQAASAGRTPGLRPALNSPLLRLTLSSDGLPHSWASPWPLESLPPAAPVALPKSRFVRPAGAAPGSARTWVLQPARTGVRYEPPGVCLYSGDCTALLPSVGRSSSCVPQAMRPEALDRPRHREAKRREMNLSAGRSGRRGCLVRRRDPQAGLNRRVEPSPRCSSSLSGRTIFEYCAGKE